MSLFQSQSSKFKLNIAELSISSLVYDWFVLFIILVGSATAQFSANCTQRFHDKYVVVDAHSKNQADEANNLHRKNVENKFAEKHLSLNLT